MRRLVFITQQIDPEHAVLAATVAKVAALARRVDEVVVLCDGAVDGVLPANCRVRTFGATTKAGRGLRFERALLAELSPRPLAVVAHMCPIYAVLAAPLVRPLRIPLVTWYTHWKSHVPLRLAELLSTRIVSVAAHSFPLRSRKLVALGHGIDTDEFPCAAGPRPPGLRALVLGRYSPAKGIEQIVRGFRIALERGLDGRLELYGTTGNPAEERHLADLRSLVATLELGDRVHLGGPLPRTEIPARLAAAHTLVNNMRAGAADKVVYEAASSCVPPLASSPGFGDLFAGIEPPLAFNRERPEELADRLLAIAALDDGQRAAIGAELRRRVVASHSVDTWAEGLIAVAEGRS